jgi:formate dehydrogenase iron-sulfur subunit
MSIDQNPRSDAGPLLIEDLLHEQQLLTPVARFSLKHESGDLPAQAKYYQDLIPLSEPKEGQQYAFAVDLDACTGCKACVTACHNLNGLDDEETWRDVGVLFGGTPAEPVQLTVTTACHHCVDPACMNGCPVKAYDKDPKTGIVRHLDDQYIGCSYCILKCPYNVPKHSKKRGIVRKCDMCSSRLAVGEAPACVQACPNEAIRITIVDKKQITAERRQKNSFLPSAPESDYTLPTTRYFSAKKLPANMRPADFYKIKPEHSHLPLVVMLVLTQLSVGAFSFALALRLLFPAPLIRAVTPFHSVVALLLGLLALGASTMHLGRPLYALEGFRRTQDLLVESRDYHLRPVRRGCDDLCGTVLVPGFRSPDKHPILALAVRSVISERSRRRRGDQRYPRHLLLGNDLPGYAAHVLANDDNVP